MWFSWCVPHQRQGRQFIDTGLPRFAVKVATEYEELVRKGNGVLLKDAHTILKQK